jgi:hypothetical protein
MSQVPIAHAYNPSYSGAEIRRIEVQSQPRQTVRKTLSQKKTYHTHTKRAGGVARGAEPEFKSFHIFIESLVYWQWGSAFAIKHCSTNEPLSDLRSVLILQLISLKVMGSPVEEEINRSGFLKDKTLLRAHLSL